MKIPKEELEELQELTWTSDYDCDICCDNKKICNCKEVQNDN